ncbi:uncharacterized protein PHALS_13995 [Plasmopara halstedii]|uniref:Uncharacterized protein n=1 Tax=Plasmopara halstedii TaxID=4781 RepID=A0A0P1AQX7_PLAHL|nr:uncharacterized protein PHALS_13995 [Plasmopara halstedii]CEG43701.1 hypothetical protein PHALS_13995 [Plasmopara halstedii]|eukprot:XP_024580070.1 hypothetical protein PHALS_13995 [Plasmopara halstedii]
MSKLIQSTENQFGYVFGRIHFIRSSRRHLFEDDLSSLIKAWKKSGNNERARDRKSRSSKGEIACDWANLVGGMFPDCNLETIAYRDDLRYDILIGIMFMGRNSEDSG